MRPSAAVRAANFAAVSTPANEVLALVRSHNERDDAAFSMSVARIKANATRKGHHNLAAALERHVKPAPNLTGQLIKLPHNLETLIVETIPSVSMSDLIVGTGTAAALRTVLDEQANRRVLLDAGFAPAARILLHGPPGTGKTMTAAVLAHELGLSLRTVRVDGVIDRYMGQASSHLRVIFDEVHSHRAVYFLDEIDALAASRGGDDVGEARRIVNTLLTMLEEAGSLSVVVAATNYTQILDHAIHRRFDLIVGYGLPTAAEARSVIDNRLGAMAADIVWDDLPEGVFNGRSQADLVHAAETAAKQALLNGRETVTGAEIADTIHREAAAAATQGNYIPE